MNTLFRARRLILTWVLVSAGAAFIITLRLGDSGVLGALLEPNVWIAASMGFFVATLASPILTAPWVRWYWGALLGLPVGLLVVFGFFFAQPHSWQPSRWDAWKSVAMFVDIYPFVIISACLLAGSLGIVFHGESDVRQRVEE